MRKIQVPPQSTIKRIAAGEVIERPASVVKELVENSLDAGTKKIIVKIEDGGKKLIEVKDDGEGMSREDAELCIQRYSTSKLREFDDLFKLSTLGFRGEALPSIAAVSQFSLLTKSKDELVGTFIEAENGKIKRKEEKASPKGTIISVKNLFLHTPARKKFLKKASTELRYISNIINKEALANPRVSFQLISNGKQIINTPNRNNISDKIKDFWGKNFTDELIPLKIKNPLFQLEGFICKPFFARRKTGQQYIFVNGRPISSRMIAAACKQGYQPVIPEERHPQVFLFFKINPEELDINIHPTKNIIKIQRENEIFGAIVEGIRNCLKNAELLPEVFFKKSQNKYKDFSQIIKNINFQRAGNLPIRGKIADLGFSEVKKPEIKEKQQGYITGLENLNIKAQLNSTYLLGEDSEGFFLLDQHAVHERILYERFKGEVGTSAVQIQNMLIPETVELGRHEASLINEKLDTLKNMGFNIEVFGENTFIIHSIPKIIKKISPSVILLDIAEEFDNMDKATSMEECTERILTTIACKAAVKAGDKLENEEIESLIKQWETTDYKNWCPHGRPVVIRFNWKEIEKKFSRRE